MKRVFSDSDLQVLADIFGISYKPETFKPITHEEITEKAAKIFTTKKTEKNKIPPGIPLIHRRQENKKYIKPIITGRKGFYNEGNN